MAELTNLEKRQLERLLGMGSGYVLDFSNRTFAEFVMDSTGRDPYDARYDYGSGSKANRLRGFWEAEPNRVVGKLVSDMLEYARTLPGEHEDALFEQCGRAVARLMQDSPVQELNSLVALGNERDFEIVAKAVKDAIERDEPETGLDRLHTFCHQVRALSL